MNEPLESDHIHTLAAGFVVDDLTPEEAGEFHELLAQHPELTQEIDDLQDVLWQVIDGLTDVETPIHLLPNLIETAEAPVSPLLEALPRSASPPIILKQRPLLPVAWKPSIPWNKLAAGLTVLLAVILGAESYRLRQDLNLVTAENRRLRQEFAQAKADVSQTQVVKALLQQPQTRLFTFKASNPNAVASGSIIMNPQQQKALMLVNNLPAPPSGKSYVLWTVVASEKVFCGEIKPYVWGDASYELPFTAEMFRDFYHPNFSGVVVTLEADPTVSRPSGPMIMQSPDI